MIKISPKEFNENLKIGKDYELSDDQKELDDQYKKVTALLNKAGYNAVYHKFWIWEKNTQPGYISLGVQEDERVSL